MKGAINSTIRLVLFVVLFIEEFIKGIDTSKIIRNYMEILSFAWIADAMHEDFP